MISHSCPVCAFPGLSEPPWKDGVPSDEICPSCGTHFGYDDVAGGDPAARRTAHRRLNERWRAQGCPWFSSTRARPPDWDPEQPLPMTDPYVIAQAVLEIDDVRIWLDDSGGIAIKAVTPSGDPVELSSAQARHVAAVLNELADQDDA